ncbi:MAG: TauD/TfdA family dioxygenase [Taibaiella sp.]|nr:TauD/TfdA family dioxygenase [Taibaiella sp.]
MSPNFLKEVAYSATPNFASEFRDTLKTYKVVHLTGVPKEVDYKTFYSGLVDQLGEIVNVDEDIKTGNANADQRWTDVRYDKDHQYTFRHANVRQPLHTDAAYVNFELDVNFFFCTEQAEIGGATTFIDSDDLIYILEKFEPELYAKLTTLVVDFGKGEDQRKRRKIIDTDDRGVKLNWNWYRVMDDNKPEVKEMCEQFHNFLEKKIVEGGLLFPVYLKPGEAAFFQDDRLLHGRNSFYGARTLIKGGFNFN